MHLGGNQRWALLCISLKFKRKTSIFLHDWFIVCTEAVFSASQIIGAGMAVHISHCAKSWLFTINMDKAAAKPVGYPFEGWFGCMMGTEFVLESRANSSSEPDTGIKDGFKENDLEI